MQLTLEEWAGGLGGSFEYNLDLFGAATVARLSGHFQQLLETVVKQPEIRLSTLVEALKETDRRQQSVKQQEFRESRRRKLKDMMVEPVGGAAQKG